MSRTVATALLLVAVTATAMRSNMGALLTQGWNSFGPIVAATGVAFLAALGAALLL